MSLPGVSEGDERFGFSVMVKGKAKGFCWSWTERVEPKKPKVVNDSVLAIMVPGLQTKEILEGSGSEVYALDPHYNGFPAVLVRLANIDKEELEDLLIEAWRCKAPKQAVKEFDANQ